MKRSVFVAFAAVICLLALTMPVLADEDTIVVKKSELTRDQLLKAEAQQKLDTVQQVADEAADTYGRYTGLGTEIGKGVNGALSSLSKNANDFANTKVGRWTIAIVAWKILGRDMIHILVGIFWTLLGIWLFVKHYKTNCIPVSMLLEEKPDGTKTYQILNNAEEEDRAMYARWAVSGIFIVWSLIGLAIFFS